MFLEVGHGFVGYFADRKADRLIVFVHGFGGKATKTWKGMEALHNNRKAGSSDIIFYGYGSLAAPARNSAQLFHNLVSAAMSRGIGAASKLSDALRRNYHGQLTKGVKAAIDAVAAS